MSGHQLIYTSCRRGLGSAYDGLQVFSHDQRFPRDQLSLLTPILTYRHPDLPPGVPETEDSAASFPQSFCYARLGAFYDIALSTYLGKDYMGPTGRFGNLLSHHVLLTNLTAYPAEFFGSDQLRTRMNYEEVNSPDPPAYLAEPQLKPSGRVTAESVREFLAEGDRIGVLKTMVACVLDHGSSNRRVIIVDEPECVIQWIAAVHYALPLASAAAVSFSTYEYSPMSADWRIVGAVGERTAYEPTADAYIFDCAGGRFPLVGLPSAFADFLEIGLLVSPDAMKDFHDYVKSNFPAYRASDASVYGLHAHHEIAAGNVSAEGISLALSFLHLHGSARQKDAFLPLIFSHSGIKEVLADPEGRPLVIAFLSSMASNGEQLLERTLDAEGHLLDLSNHEGAFAVVWENFAHEMLTTYQKDRLKVYEQLVEGTARSDQAADLFRRFLVAFPENSTSLFDEVTGVARSPDQCRLFAEVYYRYSRRAVDNRHLLDFVMASGVLFAGVQDLVAKVASGIRYDEVIREQARIARIYKWVVTSHFDMGATPRVWYLGSLLSLLTAQRDIKEAVDWMAATAHQIGVAPVPNDESFVHVLLPVLLGRSKTGRELGEYIWRLRLAPVHGLLQKLFALCRTSQGFSVARWQKVAEYVFEAMDENLLAEFAALCLAGDKADRRVMRHVLGNRYKSYYADGAARLATLLDPPRRGLRDKRHLSDKGGESDD